MTRPAACHPDRPHVAKGMCRSCYRQRWNEEHFPNRGTRDGHPVTCLHGVRPTKDCDECRRIRNRKSERRRYERDPEQVRAKQRVRGQRYRTRNRETLRERTRTAKAEAYKTDPDKFRARVQAYQAANPDKVREWNRLKRHRLTRKPLVGPVSNYEGERTYLDCPHCGTTELINVADRPLRCQVCESRVRREHIWLFTPVSVDRERRRRLDRERYARMREEQPERLRAMTAAAYARVKARREAQAQRVGRLPWPPPTEPKWLTWEEAA